MAQKRRIEGGAPVAPPSAVNRDETVDEPEDFVSWVKGTYAKWWYGLLCLFIDAFVLVTLWESLDTSFIAEVLIMTLLILVTLEYIVYRKLWPEKVRELEDDE
jgi:RsiW-degrading membrane proteinase PrsW (M82 family)